MDEDDLPRRRGDAADQLSRESLDTYSQDELDEQARQQEYETKMAQMPETVEQLKAENEDLRKSFTTMESAQTDTDSLMVDQEYRLTLLELGITPDEKE